MPTKTETRVDDLAEGVELDYHVARSEGINVEIDTKYAVIKGKDK